MEFPELVKHQAQIEKLCLEHHVKSLFAFGSVVTPQFNEDSDIDLIVDIDTNDPFAYSDYYFDLKFKLEDLFCRPVDLLEQKAIKNPYLIKELDHTKVLIYGK